MLKIEGNLIFFLDHYDDDYDDNILEKKTTCIFFAWGLYAINVNSMSAYVFHKF